MKTTKRFPFDEGSHLVDISIERSSSKINRKKEAGVYRVSSLTTTSQTSPPPLPLLTPPTTNVRSEVSRRWDTHDEENLDNARERLLDTSSLALPYSSRSFLAINLT
ncbi:hypothetical protein M0802_004215 [Mischocyttarus mexicanus]|nr:hypothetical protein M0802_004215 [Mischocyttarus mexicanus]